MMELVFRTEAVEPVLVRDCFFDKLCFFERLFSGVFDPFLASDGALAKLACLDVDLEEVFDSDALSTVLETVSVTRPDGDLESNCCSSSTSRDGGLEILLLSFLLEPDNDETDDFLESSLRTVTELTRVT